MVQACYEGRRLCCHIYPILYIHICIYVSVSVSVSVSMSVSLCMCMCVLVCECVCVCVCVCVCRYVTRGGGCPIWARACDTLVPGSTGAQFGTGFTGTKVRILTLSEAVQCRRNSSEAALFHAGRLCICTSIRFGYMYIC